MIFRHLDLIVDDNDDGWCEIKKKYVFDLGSSKIFKRAFEAFIFISSALSIKINLGIFSIAEVSKENWLIFLIWSIMIKF